MAKVNLKSPFGTRDWYSDEGDPMSSLGNLADVMLVFACGLMVALITLLNVDLSTVTEMLREDQVAEVQAPEEIDDKLHASDGTAYIDMGRVYLDPTTGKYYMITEGDKQLLDANAQSVAASSEGDLGEVHEP